MKLLLYVLGDDHRHVFGVLTLDWLREQVAVRGLHDEQVNVAGYPGKC